ncbi:MAG TPA: serine/threonine-protein kinase [Kofleriaceae bacterium]
MRASTRSPTRVWTRPGEPGPTFGVYQLHEELDSDEVSLVHRATEHGSQAPVALKRLRPQAAANRDALETFLADAKLSSQLRHPHIQQTHAYGKLGGTYFIVQEMIAGPTLHQVMVQSASSAGAVPLPIVVKLLVQLCDALDYLHTRTAQIIHRDVAPTNVLVANTGSVKLTNFASAKVPGSPATGHGIIKGTLGYVAPESTFGHLDVRADLFSLGVIAHELLAGRPLFGRAKDYATMWRVREKPIQPPSRWNPHVSRDLDDIVLTALQRDPDLRWQNAAAMRFALNAIAESFGAIDGKVIRDWTEWAFTKKPIRDTGLVRVLEEITA